MTGIIETLPLADDLHVHLREGKMMEHVTSLIRGGGSSRVLVMPNLENPIQSCEEALNYKNKLQAVESQVEFLMTLYLTHHVKIEDLKANANRSGVTGIKMYPKGVTTNSAEGVESVENYFHIFKTMEDLGLVLHIHGEMPGASPLDAESEFLTTLEKIASVFPNLKIVFEHVTTASAVDLIKSLPNVGATITAHHLELTTEDVLDANGDVHLAHNFCKPLAKTSRDKTALWQVIQESHPKFFLGSDSAPHRRSSKEGLQPPAAGIFTSPLLVTYLCDSFGRMGVIDKLQSFACEFGTRFLKLQPKELSKGDYLTVEKKTTIVPTSYEFDDDLVVVPFRAGETLNYKVTLHSATQ